MSKKHKVSYREQKATKTYYGKTKVFAYGTLMLHDIQAMLWGETMSGKNAVLLDYELHRYPNNILYIKKMFGESVVGKIYELDKDQLEATDNYEGKAYTRTQVKIGDDIVYTYVQNKEMFKDEDNKADTKSN